MKIIKASKKLTALAHKKKREVMDSSDLLIIVNDIDTNDIESAIELGKNMKLEDNVVVIINFDTFLVYFIGTLNEVEKKISELKDDE
jgi:hypothetical protein